MTVVDELRLACCLYFKAGALARFAAQHKCPDKARAALEAGEEATSLIRARLEALTRPR